MITFSIGMGILCGLLVAVSAPIFPHIYNTTEEVRTLAVELTLILAVASPLHSYLHAVYFTLRSGGKTLITFLFDSGYVWCVNVVLAFFLCRFTALSLPLVYLIVHLSDSAKAVLGCFFVRNGGWATDLTQNT
jgi:Na+-driven multidrug efflux pump